MVSVICLGNSENRNESIRLERLFDLMDFNGAGKISSDELTILLLCVGQAFTFIMEGKVSDEKAQVSSDMNAHTRLHIHTHKHARYI